MTYIFRNTTAELLFGGAGYSYSGYDELNVPGVDADSYVWFYTVPILADAQAAAKEISSYAERLSFVHSQLPATKPLYVFTLVNLFESKSEVSDFSVAQAIAKFNAFVVDFAAQNSNVKILDFAAFCSRYAQADLVDWKFYFMSQAAISPKLAGPFRKWFAAEKDATVKTVKKCLILDLDNTLWGGILGEDGPEHLKIGGDYPGKAFHFFQEQILELQKRGVILAICSKNNEPDAWDFIEQSRDQVLRKEHFAAWRINWTDKATNIRELAQELNIGLDSMVFLDDSPTERELVASMVPEVVVPEFPAAPYALPVFFNDLKNQYFKIYEARAEDREKTLQYKANAERHQLQSQFTNIDDFINSLNIETTIRVNDDADFPRIAQMSQKTNQFNLTGKRYTDLEIAGIKSAGGYVFSLSVKDKFGDSGMTGAAVVSVAGDAATIDNLFLSCRILGRKIENTFMKAVFEQLRAAGIKSVRASYVKTIKNTSVADYYASEHFKTVSETESEKQYLYSF